MLTISIAQFGHGFAGEVMGIDCRKPLSSNEVAAIHSGMNDYAVLVFRDQQLSDEEQLQFTLHFGTLEETRGGTPSPIHFRTSAAARSQDQRLLEYRCFRQTAGDGEPSYLFKLADQYRSASAWFDAIRSRVESPCFYQHTPARSKACRSRKGECYCST
jgi:hypothetical protein